MDTVLAANGDPNAGIPNATAEKQMGMFKVPSGGIKDFSQSFGGDALAGVLDGEPDLSVSHSYG
jgi:hypothetical protein